MRERERAQNFITQRFRFERERGLRTLLHKDSDLRERERTQNFITQGFRFERERGGAQNFITQGLRFVCVCVRERERKYSEHYYTRIKILERENSELYYTRIKI